EPERERELLELLLRREVLASRDGDDGAGGAEAFAAAPLPEPRVGVEGRVPQAVALPDVDLLAVDHAAHAPESRFRIRSHRADYTVTGRTAGFPARRQPTGATPPRRKRAPRPPRERPARPGRR